MASRPCPSCGAASTTSDYCDACGAALNASSRSNLTASAASAGAETLSVAQAPAAEGGPVVAPGEPCPGCGMVRGPDDLFCEGCGVDFTTGRVPGPSAPEPVEGTRGLSRWIALIDADRAVFDRNQAECDQAFTFPARAVRREVPLQSGDVIVGRRHAQKGFFPDIDLAEPVLDPGVSRRHAVLRRQSDDSWGVFDTDSTNGTWLNADPAPLRPGVLVALHDGDRIHLGLFTVITVRRESEASN